MLEGTKLYSIFKGKCPRCHQTDLFTNRNPYNFSTLFDMPEKCSHCGLKFMVEPGFYYGAMYVSYGVSIAYLVSVYVAMLVLYADFSATEYLVLSIASLIVLTPYFFRLSRLIWINMFIAFDSKYQ